MPGFIIPAHTHLLAIFALCLSFETTWSITDGLEVKDDIDESIVTDHEQGRRTPQATVIGLPQQTKLISRHGSSNLSKWRKKHLNGKLNQQTSRSIAHVDNEESSPTPGDLENAPEVADLPTPEPLQQNSDNGRDKHMNCTEFDFKNRSTIGLMNTTSVVSHCHLPNESLTCFQDPIFCEAYHLSGRRDLTWPVYGEYSYLAHEHWFKVLQHGGVAFLYHPCLHDELVAELRSLAEQCLRRFVMTPYAKLSSEKPIALVTWGCYLLMPKVDFIASKRWMRHHSFKGPSSHVHENGNFEKKLVKPAQLVTDVKDTFLCPDESEKASLLSTQAPPKTSSPLRVGEKLLLHRLAKVQHKKTIVHVNVTLTKVNKSNAAWAMGSLVFLCGLLVALMVYTKLWKHDGRDGRYQYASVFDHDQELGAAKKRRFNFMKSSQSLIGKMKRKRFRGGDKMSQMKLLTPIDEENEELGDEF